MASPYAQPTSDFVTTTLNGALAAGGTTATIGSGLDIPATNGLLQLDYDSDTAVGSDNGPETVSYASYTSATGALTGLTRGLANTTAVAHANGASVQMGPSSLYFSDQASGWTSCLETWAYASATTITVPSDATTKYSVGDKIRLKQGAGYKYFYVAAVAATVLTVTGGTDYTVANSAITDNDFSKAASPVGFPGRFEVGTNKWITMNGRQATSYGWDYVQFGGSAPEATKAITYGFTFAERPTGVSVTTVGMKNNSNPSHIGDTTNQLFASSAQAVSTTGLTAQVVYHDASENNLANTWRGVFSWVVTGII